MKEHKVKYWVVGQLGSVGSVIEECHSLAHANEVYKRNQKHYSNVCIRVEYITIETKYYTKPLTKQSP